MTDMAPNDERTVGEVAVPKVEMRQISDRSSLRSDAPQGSARHAAAPLQQIAEVLEAQEEAKVALEEAARDKNVRELSTCVSEFVSTEARYLADLQSVAVAFLEPLRPLLPPQLHYAIFSNLPQLQGLHQGLGTDLERATSETASDSGQACVDAFSKLLPYFRMYATYCCNYPNVAEALCKVAAEHSGAATALVEAEEARGVKLQALLFRPVQRLCVYPQPPERPSLLLETLSALKLLARRRNRYPLLLERMKKSSQPKSQMRITCESAFAALQALRFGRCWGGSASLGHFRDTSPRRPQELNSEVNERVRQMEASSLALTSASSAARAAAAASAALASPAARASSSCSSACSAARPVRDGAAAP